MSYNSKDPSISARELEVQSLHCICDLSQSSGGVADLQAVVLSGAAATKTITLTVGEAIKSCQAVRIINRATGAIVATTVVPDISVANKISVIAVGTGVTSADVEFLYTVA
jgi:hypothetical protein